MSDRYKSRAGAQLNNSNEGARSSSREDDTKQKKKKKMSRHLLFGRHEAKEEETEQSSSRPQEQQQYHQEQQAAFQSSQYQQQQAQQQRQRYTTQQAMGGPRTESVSAEFRENPPPKAPNHHQQVRSSMNNERRFISPSHNVPSNNNSSSLVSSSDQDILAKQQGRRISSAGSANSTRRGTNNREDVLAAERRRNSSVSRRSTNSSSMSSSDQDILAKQQGRYSGSGPPTSRRSTNSSIMSSSDQDILAKQQGRPSLSGATSSPGAVAVAIREDKAREKRQQNQPTSNAVSRGSSVSRLSDNRDVLAKQQGLQGRWTSGTESTTRPGAVAVAIREDNTLAKRLGRTAADSAAAVHRNSRLYSTSTYGSSNTQPGAVALAIREDSAAAKQEGRTADASAAASRLASTYTLGTSVELSWEESLYALEAELRTNHSSGHTSPRAFPGDATPVPLDIERRRNSAASSGRMSVLTRTSDLWVDPIDEMEEVRMLDTSMYRPNITNDLRRNSNGAASSISPSGQGSRFDMSGNLTNDLGNHTRGAIKGRSDLGENVSVDSYDTTFEDNTQRPPLSPARPIYPALEMGSIIPADDLTVQAYVPVVERFVEPTAVVPVMSEQEETKLEFRKYGRYALCAATFFLVVVVSITVPIFSGRFKSAPRIFVTPEPSTTPSVAPSLSPSLAPSSKGFMDVIDAVKDITPRDIFLDSSSPQFKAAEFMADLDPFGIRPVSDAYFLRRYALVTFYFATNGDNWIFCGRNTMCSGLEDSWLSGTDECNWMGVFCDGNDIYALRLGTGPSFLMGLSGTIPEEIGFLTSLSAINILNSKHVSGRGIGGTIPSSFSRLVNLTQIQLTQNSLVSPIHDEWLVNAKLAEIMLLFDNEFDGTINTLFASLPNLFLFSLEDNMFTGTIPSEFGSSTSLGSLGLASNNLTGSIPANFYNISELELLYLQDNRLTGSIPPNAGKLTQLEMFNVTNNAMTGTIPQELYGMSALRSLYLSGNDFKGPMLNEFGASLEIAELQNNGFTGTIPSTLAKARSIKKLFLHNNNFVGVMPDELCNALVTDNVILGHITVLTADCEEVNCTCCTTCYPEQSSDLN